MDLISAPENRRNSQQNLTAALLQQSRGIFLESQEGSATWGLDVGPKGLRQMGLVGSLCGARLLAGAK